MIVVMLPWYLRPIQPSRVVPLWVWHVLPSVLVLAFFVSFVVFLGPPTPDAFPDHMFPVLTIAPWAGVAAGLAGRRHSGARRLGVSIPGLILIATAMTVLAAPALVWPRWPDDEPVPGVVATACLLCWLSAGVLSAVGLYLALRETFRAEERPASGP